MIWEVGSHLPYSLRSGTILTVQSNPASWKELGRVGLDVLGAIGDEHSL